MAEQQEEAKARFWRSPLDEGKICPIRGKVIILEERCKGCGFCIQYCPRGVLRFSKAFNSRGYHPPEVVEGSQCVNCHFCEVLCPEFAIYSVEAD